MILTARKRMFKDEPWFEDYLRKAYCEDRKTMAQIGKELSCSPAAVLAHLRRLNIETRGKHDYPASDKQREHMRQLGCSRKGVTISEKTIEAIRKARKNKRFSAGHEFGGHEKKRSDGYIAVYFPEHPHSSKSGYVMKHVLVMEREIGRNLAADEVVHHINRIKDDNRFENLQLMTKHDHMSMHNKMRYAERKNRSVK